MPQTIDKPIVIHISGKVGVSSARGRISRVVGNSMAYVDLDSGDSLAFSAEDIDNYGGQSFRRLGVYEGAPVRVTNDPRVTSRISIHLKDAPTESLDNDQLQLEQLIAKALEQPGVKEVMQVYGQWHQTTELTATLQSFENFYPPSTVTSSSQLA